MASRTGDKKVFNRSCTALHNCMSCKHFQLEAREGNVIDSRYRSGKPMIVTTNLTAEQLKKPEDVASGRIYDRILERCHPLKIDGESMRRKKLREDFGEIEAMLKGEKQ